MSDIITKTLQNCSQALEKLKANHLALTNLSRAGEQLVACFKNGGRVYTCGNGGSMCDAMHLAEELSGRFRQNRPSLPALAISDPSHLTCTSNDFGFQYVFSRFIEGFGSEKDILFAISTSGTSANCLLAAEAAKSKKMTVITLTGRSQSPLGKLADIDICTETDSKWADRIQELHIKCIHILIELCEKNMFGIAYD